MTDSPPRREQWYNGQSQKALRTIEGKRSQMPKKNAKRKSTTTAAQQSGSASQTRPNVADVCFVEDFLSRYPYAVLETLLVDHTTGRNIIWASDTYAELGDGYAFEDELTVERITGDNAHVIRPRVAKRKESQARRTKTHAEVFTPSWLCNLMLNHMDEDWFERKGVFSVENEDHTWTVSDGEIEFPKTKERGWRAYIESTRLEITCGEAPFVCSRYDTTTGEVIDVPDRIGFLDRKLRVVREHSSTKKTWYKNAMTSLKASYGYEYQGDNLLIARINVLETFFEHMMSEYGCEPTLDEMNEVAWVVSWNMWQMNGLTYAPPTKGDDAIVAMSDRERVRQAQTSLECSLFDMAEDGDDDGSCGDDVDSVENDALTTAPVMSLIYDWEADEPFEFISLKNS